MFRLATATTRSLTRKPCRCITYSRQYFEDMNIDRDAI